MSKLATLQPVESIDLASPAANVFLLTVNGNGAFKVWRPSPPSLDESMHRRFKRRGGFWHCAERGDAGRWEAIEPTLIGGSLEVCRALVFDPAEPWRHTGHNAMGYAAELAAVEAGRAELIDRLERRGDGSLVCPHCGAGFRCRGHFARHLHRGHRDTAAATVVEGEPWVIRNGRTSPAASFRAVSVAGWVMQSAA